MFITSFHRLSLLCLPVTVHMYQDQPLSFFLWQLLIFHNMSHHVDRHPDDRILIYHLLFILCQNVTNKNMCIKTITNIPSTSEKHDIIKAIIVTTTGGIINKYQSPRFQQIYKTVGISQTIHKIIKAISIIYHLPI